MTDAILVFNAGSSSIKFALHPAVVEGAPLLTGKIDGIGRAPDFTVRDARGNYLPEDDLQEIQVTADHEQLTTRLLEWLQHHQTGINLVAAGHRVVHGGRDFTGPAIIDADVLGKMQQLVSLAPSHQPHNLAAINAVSAWDPGLPQIACFDTSFHRTQPRLAQLFGLPHELTDQGILKYGFHGLSYEYIASVLPEHLGSGADARVVVAHLGNGASMCAMKHRHSVASSTGFSALHGLIMGRRCGTLDAGVVLHLIQQQGMSADQVRHLLYQESGLFGVSGISNNMKVLEASADPRAKEAIDLFCYRAACELGSLAASLEGLDAIVFTAGIGENSATVRDRICRRLGWLGVDVDQSANQANDIRISTSGSGVTVLVLPTNEELVIARSVRSLTGLAEVELQLAL